MEETFSTGQNPQWAVVPVEEEEEFCGEGRGERPIQVSPECG
jgi:hypothetical protein